MNRHKLRQLKAVYAKIPKIICAGHCSETCGAIGLTRGEFRHLTLITRQRPQIVDGDRCNYLKENRCSVYQDRPSICRLWGVTDALKCKWGCVPERLLTEAEARAIMDEISDLFGEPKGSFIDNLPLQFSAK